MSLEDIDFWDVGGTDRNGQLYDTGKAHIWVVSQPLLRPDDGTIITVDPIVATTGRAYAYVANDPVNGLREQKNAIRGSDSGTNSTS